MNRLLAVAAAILLLGAGAPRALAQDFVLSISFDGGGWFDRSFNEGTWAGISEAVRELRSLMSRLACAHQCRGRVPGMPDPLVVARG